jgi:hypothetical protein
VEREPLLCHIPFLLLTFYYLPPNLNPTNLMILKFIPVHNLKKKKEKRPMKGLNLIKKTTFKD